MSDLLREIDEELQRERMALLWRKYQKLILGAIALVIFGTASHTAWKQHIAKTEITRSVALGSVASRPNMAEAEKIEAFQAFAKANSGSGQAVLAQMAAIAGLIHADKKDEALKALDALANEPSALPMTRDYARLVRVELLLDSGDPVALRQQLEPLAQAGQPWRFSARMLQGVLYGKHGDFAKAKDILKALSEDTDAPTTMRDEAKQLARYYATQG